MRPPEVRHDRIDAGGVTPGVTQAGPRDEPPVVLIHGPPEATHGLHHQEPARAVAAPSASCTTTARSRTGRASSAGGSRRRR